MPDVVSLLELMSTASGPWNAAVDLVGGFFSTPIRSETVLTYEIGKSTFYTVALDLC